METEIERDGSTEDEEPVLPFDEEPGDETLHDTKVDDAGFDALALEDGLDPDEAERLENVALAAFARLRTEQQVEEQFEQPAKLDTEQPTGFEWLTVERLLYGLILAIAGLIRFLDLAALPLSTLEAANAWTAWIAVLGDGLQIGPGTETAAPIASSALLYSLHASLLWLAGGGDVLVRSIPALVGTALVLLPWLWRATIGRQMALVLALLLAVDPWLVAYSRLADGVILSIFLGLLTLTGLHMLVSHTVSPEERTRWRMLTAVGAGLLLISGTQAWSMVIVLALFVLFFNVNINALLTNTENATGQSVESDEAEDDSTDSASDIDTTDAEKYRSILADDEPGAASFRFTPLIALLIAAVLGSTAWLARLEGVGYVSSSISFWVAQLSGAQGGSLAPTSIVVGPYPISWVLLRLLIDQPLLLFFGIIGIISAALARNSKERTATQKRWMSFLLGWLLVGIFLLLLPGRGPFSLFMIGLPLLAAAATMVDRVLMMARTSLRAMEAWILFFILTTLTVSGRIYLNVLVGQNQFNSTTAFSVVVLFVVALLATLLYGLWSSRQEAIGVAGLFAVLLLLVSTLSSSWYLAHRFDLQEPDAFFAEYSDPDVRQLADNIGTISARRIGDATEIPIQVQQQAGADPLLGWYLRDMRNLSWSPSPGADDHAARKPLLVTYLNSGYDGQANENYLSSDFGLRLSWLPSQLPRYEPLPDAGDTNIGDMGFFDRINNGLNERWARQTQPLLRWMLYHKIPSMPPSERVLLWVPPGEQ